MLTQRTIWIDGAAISDAISFHQVFACVLGFPAFYGNNLSAWVDCMSDLDDPTAGMSSVVLAPGETLVIAVDHASDFKRNCPDMWQALLECAAFVNWRRVEQGTPALLLVSAYA
jgi:hypothetical protein